MKVGDTTTLLFHGFGMVSEEDWWVISNIDKEKNQISLDNDCDPDWIFDATTGRCINDNDYGGCYRTIKPIKI